jgi:tetratricopeptide (TPR) repeat protein
MSQSRGGFLFKQGVKARDAGKLSRAAPLFQAAWEAGEPRALSRLIHTLVRMGEPQQARALMPAEPPVGLERTEICRYRLAEAALLQVEGQAEEAIAVCRAGLAEAIVARSPGLHAAAEENLAALLVAVGRSRDALGHLESAIRLARGTDQDHFVGAASARLAHLYVNEGDYARAGRTLSELGHPPSPQVRTMAQTARGELEFGLGQIERARDRFQAALLAAEESGRVAAIRIALRWLAVVSSLTGDYLDALLHFHRYRSLSRTPIDRLYDLHLEGILAHRRGDSRIAIEVLTAAAGGLRQQPTERFYFPGVLLHLAQAYFVGGHRAEACHYLVESIKLAWDSGFDQEHVVRARTVMPLLEYAAHQPGHTDYAKPFLERVRAHPQRRPALSPRTFLSPGAPIEVRAFGRGEVRLRGSPVSFRLVNAPKLLIRLLISPAPRGYLEVDALPEKHQTAATSYVKNGLSELRRTIGSGFIRCDPDTREYYVEPGADIRFDVDEFRESLKVGDIHHALALAGRGFLTDLDTDWVEEVRNLLKHDLLVAAWPVLDGLAEDGQHESRLELLKGLRAFAPDDPHVDRALTETAAFLRAPRRSSRPPAAPTKPEEAHKRAGA